jgi:hypothetical protein
LKNGLPLKIISLNILLCNIWIYAFPTPIEAWGLETHKVINELACYTLPSSALKKFFFIHKEYISEHAIDPDVTFKELYGREEVVKHFINLDAYGTYPFRRLPRDYYQAVKQYGKEKIYQEGILPWWIIRLQEDLQRAMEQNDWQRVCRHASHLGHYIADLFMPLHTTENHDGQLTGNNGIHKRLEDGLVDSRIEQYRAHILRQLQIVQPIPFTLDEVFNILLQSYLLVPSILRADKEAFQGLVKFIYIPYLYYNHLDYSIGGMLKKQLIQACQLLGNVWYTSWLQAGSPLPPADIHLPGEAKILAPAPRE